ncbi:DUF4870 domain-containing protein [Chryseobacterium sp. PBS4-4]|uniref:DUF4870 domain-containing protein n=1 Tax=Chryseobacterium edaphi TaxID=2976532 RepID=A0ABT2WBC7_9FLAO|nr:DUF4870 domain-containing protein [Chryseobacterium edaphi]MCU7617945.1 DUF4870 domain-containing protein [Chryseobacterium edaphi]
MNQKTLSIVSYITIIGWLLAYFSSKEERKNPMLLTHLQQGLGLSIISFVVGIAVSAIASVVPALGLLSLVNILFFILMIVGIINAAIEKNTVLPIIGGLFEGKFSFISQK